MCELSSDSLRMLLTFDPRSRTSHISLKPKFASASPLGGPAVN
jgi:hypothetical protein